MGYRVETNLEEVFHNNRVFPPSLNIWDFMAEEKDHIKCPFCGQSAKREDIENGTHVCWGMNDNTHKTTGIWE